MPAPIKVSLKNRIRGGLVIPAHEDEGALVLPSPNEMITRDGT